MPFDVRGRTRATMVGAARGPERRSAVFLVHESRLRVLAARWSVGREARETKRNPIVVGTEA